MLALPWKVGPQELSVLWIGIGGRQQVEADAKPLQKIRTGPYTALHYTTLGIDGLEDLVMKRLQPRKACLD